MKDIDFEELDKAVSALVSGGPAASPKDSVKKVVSANETRSAKTPPPASRDTAKTEAVVVSRPAQTKPTERSISVTSIASEPKRAVAPSPIKRPVPLVPVRGSGSFMDIVSSKPDKPASHRPSRSGVSLRPISDDKTLRDAATPSTKTPTPLAPVEKPVPGVVASEFLSDDEEKWPDPIDFSDTASTNAGPEQTAQPAPEPDDAVDTNSPFLADTKVEKRPLGAFAAKPEDTPANTYESPEELNPGIPESSAALSEPASRASTSETIGSAPAPAEPTTATAPTKQELHDKAMLSIPQQYKTSEAIADKAERPVFDTKEYHPPLLEETAHGGHKKSSVWNKLFIVLLIIALLAVGAYFAFVYFVQMQP